MKDTPKARHRSYERSRRQIARARNLRKISNEPEADAWNLLRDFRKDGYVFRRQHPVGRYVVDFCCTRWLLVVEIDGSAHVQTDQRLHDMRRDAWLKSRGYTILRISSGEVLKAPSQFVVRVLDALAGLKLRRPKPPHPCPLSPCGGEGWVNA